MQMDELIDSYISSSVWPDTTLQKSPWNGAMVSQTNGLIDDSLEPHGHGNNQITGILPPDDMIGNTTAEGLNLHGHNGAKSIFTYENMKYEADQDICFGERSTHINFGGQTLQQTLANNDIFDGTCSLQGTISNIAAAESFDSAIAHNTVAISSSIESNGNEMSTFSQVLGDAYSINSFPAIWPSSYSGVSSFTRQNRLQGIGHHDVQNSDNNSLMKACLENGTHLNSFNSIPLCQKEQNGFKSISNGQQISLRTCTLQPENEFQFSTNTESLNTSNQIINSGRAQGGPTNANDCNGVAKPRVRARRGQATDPHSIAERLRREKIAERMRNLQELVPSSNKTDKASMLDEIIDYVKFLQLQVKVLSMSRLGAAGAVLPLLTNARTEGSESVLVSSSTEEGALDIFDSEESLALEQEVVKLMETNVTSAVQYLQNKGVCLMPIALAAAISSQKGSSTVIPPERRKPDVNSHNLIERGPDNGANSCNGAVVKQEEPQRPRNNGVSNQQAE